MIKDMIIKNKIYIILTVLVFTVIIISVSLYRILVFQVVSTSPRNGGQVNIGSSIIVVNLNKKINKINIEQVVASENIIKNVITDNESIKIYTKDVVDKKDYIIYIKDITSEDNQKISLKYNFTGKYIPFNQQSAQIKKESIQSTDRGNFNDRAAEILPETTDKFSLTYDVFSEPSQKGKYIKITAALLVLNYEQTDLNLLKNYKNDALRFLRSNGVNPEDYVIDWYPRAAQNL
jgi:hypothetical protein